MRNFFFLYPVVCQSCRLIRIGEIDATESEQECHSTAKDECPVCKCPYAYKVKGFQGNEVLE